MYSSNFLQELKKDYNGIAHEDENTRIFDGKENVQKQSKSLKFSDFLELMQKQHRNFHKCQKQI